MSIKLGRPESFQYLTHRWDVAAAKAILRKTPRAVTDINIQGAKAFIATIMIQPKLVETADVLMPIIVVHSPFGSSPGYFPIDGWHRIAWAINNGRSYLPAYILTPEEGDLCLQFRRRTF